MEKAKELINQIYLDVKKHYPEFEYRKYDTSDTVYFGQTSRQFPGKNGNGFKFYKEYNRYKVGVKSNLKTGKLDDHVFLLPEQFEQARACIFTLYEIPLTGPRTKSWTIRNGNTTCITMIKNLRLSRCISDLRTIPPLGKLWVIQTLTQRYDVG